MPSTNKKTKISSFSERLASIIEPQSILSFAKKCGLSDSLLRKYLGGSLPGLDNLIKIADAAGVSVEWLATGRGPIYTEECLVIGKQGEFALIGLVNVELSAGGGTFVQDERTKELYAFRRDWLNRVCLAPSKAVLMRVRGDSMHPTISDGDTVMIDTARKNITPGKIFALRMEDTVMLKRLEPMPGGKVRIISDNPIYKEYEADSDSIHILGQVIWIAKELEKPEI